MTESFLPDIINKIGNYKESRLLQPMMKVKRVGLSRKHDWIKASALKKLSIFVPYNTNKYSPRLQPKRNRQSRQRFATEQKETIAQQLLIQKCKNYPENKNSIKPCELMLLRQRLASQDNYMSLNVDDKNRWRQLKSIQPLNRKVRRYTSVCSNHNKSIANMIEPLSYKSPPKSKIAQDFNLAPWQKEQ